MSNNLNEQDSSSKKKQPTGIDSNDSPHSNESDANTNSPRHSNQVGKINVGMTNNESVTVGDISENKMVVNGDGSINYVKGDLLNIYPPTKPNMQDIVMAYLKRLCVYHNTLPLDIIAKNNNNDDLNLSTVYIHPDTETEIKLTDSEKKLDQYKGKSHRLLTVTQAVEKATRLVLLGNPGSGKSSFVRHLVINEAQKKIQGHETAMFPLIIDLKYLAARLPDIDPEGIIKPEIKRSLRQAVIDQWVDDIADLMDDVRFDKSKLLQVLKTEKIILIFDGFDEVPDSHRYGVQQAIEAIISPPKDKPPRKISKIIITCRTRSYSNEFAGFDPHTLAPFSQAKIENFISRWYMAAAASGRLTSRIAQKRIKDLQQSATANQDMWELAENPLLLTTMAIIHKENSTLPRHRVLLYSKAIDLLLLDWQTTREIVIDSDLKALLSKKHNVIRILERFAHNLHQAQAQNKDLRLESSDLIHWLKQELGSPDLAEKFLNYIDLRTGLLIGIDGTYTKAPRYKFPHRTFQEYLAGCFIFHGSATKVSKTLRGLSTSSDFWREAVQLGFEEYSLNRDSLEFLSEIASKLLYYPIERENLWSGYIANLIKPELIQQKLEDELIKTNYKDELRKGLTCIIESLTSNLTINERAEAGQLINLVEDRREGVGVKNNLPDLLWCKSIPIGTYDYADENYNVEKSYQLSAYPITYAQFQCFEDSINFGNVDFWKDMPSGHKKYGKRRDIKQIEPQGFPFENHPREMVNWFQAVAFCRWLTAQLNDKYIIRLPNEVEWVVAARYSDGRTYPWGEETDDTKLNYNGKVGKTTAVGLYPAGRNSNLNLYDMSGNVREWCLNKSNDLNQVHVDTSPAGRVLRGGSWARDHEHARAEYRLGYSPFYSFNYLGFRVCRVERG